MAYESTAVPVARSQEAIRKLILQNAGIGVAFVSQPPTEGFHAQIPIEGKTYTIRIVAEGRSKEQIRTDLGKRRRRNPDAKVEFLYHQEEKRIWRVLFYHMKGLFEAANSGVLEFRELVLPYIVTRDGRTIGECILPQLDKAVQSDPAQLLGTGKE